MVPPASHKIARVSWYSGYRLAVACRSLRDSHPLWSHIPVRSSRVRLRCVGPTTPSGPKTRRFGLIPVRSPLLRDSLLISLRRATEMFQFAHFPPYCYALTARSPDMTLEELPHSDSWGSSLVCSSPQTFRRSPRPSSAFSTRASTSYSSLLVVCFCVCVCVYLCR